MIKIHPFGPSAVFHHIGMVVHSIQDVCPECQIFEDPIQKVNVAFMTLHEQQLELIEPNDEKSPVLLSLQKGNKLVHLCYEVEDIEQALSLGAKQGFHCIAKPISAVAFNMRKIAWVFHRSYGLFELLEQNHS